MVHRSEILLKFDTINSEKEGGRQRVQFDESRTSNMQVCTCILNVLVSAFALPGSGIMDKLIEMEADAIFDAVCNDNDEDQQPLALSSSSESIAAAHESSSRKRKRDASVTCIPQLRPNSLRNHLTKGKLISGSNSNTVTSRSEAIKPVLQKSAAPKPATAPAKPATAAPRPAAASQTATPASKPPASRLIANKQCRPHSASKSSKFSKPGGFNNASRPMAKIAGKNLSGNSSTTSENTSYKKSELNRKAKHDLISICDSLHLENDDEMTKNELVTIILSFQDNQKRVDDEQTEPSTITESLSASSNSSARNHRSSLLPSTPEIIPKTSSAGLHRATTVERVDAGLGQQQVPVNKAFL